MSVSRICIGVFSVLSALSAQAFTPQSLWETWPGSRLVTTAAPCLSHTQLMQSMTALQSWYPKKVILEEVGRSYLGKPIKMLRLGTGKQTILLWSQMHGDEPSATPALLDIANYLLEHADNPVNKSILDTFTLLMIPMLNPDGAEVYQRFNAQGIDINRDALHLTTVEGRLLKKVRDQYKPMMGFNLHDQNRRTAVGDSGQLASIAVLSVSGDPDNTVTEGRRLTKRAAAVVVESLSEFRPGGIARYDEDWSPTAFGDNLTAWGTPVLLIESGGVPVGTDFTDLTRLNFVAILSVLQAMASDNLASVDVQIYEDLLRNQSRVWSDVALRGGYIMQPGTPTAYRADLAFDVFQSDQQVAGCVENPRYASQIAMVGDSSFRGAGLDLNASNQLIVLPFEVGIRGWDHAKWLNHENLARLTQMGVGRLYWAVSKERHEKASKLVTQMAGSDAPEIAVVTKPDVFPLAVMSGPPPQVRPANLQGLLKALGLEKTDTEYNLQQMWMKTSVNNSPAARLMKNRPASFLVIAPVREGQVNFELSQLQAVWLNGREITSD
jgi:hypothetical protein